MDLIYTDERLEDVGVIPWAKGDFSEGAECSWGLTAGRMPGLGLGCAVYVDGTDLGGVVDSVETDTETGAVTYSGRTWLGMLAEAIVCPQGGSAYAAVSGDANSCVARALELAGSPVPFAASGSASPLDASYRFPRYCTLLDGLRSMLSAAGGVLGVSFSRGTCTLSALPAPEAVAWSDGDALTLRSGTSVNHLICLGHGEGAGRAVAHLYADGLGRVSGTQTLRGTRHRAQVYDYPNAKDLAELVRGGTKRLRALQSADAAKLNDAITGLYSLGQVLTCRDVSTGGVVSQVITEKIGRVDGGVLTVEYKTGAAPQEPEGAD